jgi:hypothetical protein
MRTRFARKKTTLTGRFFLSAAGEGGVPPGMGTGGARELVGGANLSDRKNTEHNFTWANISLLQRAGRSEGVQPAHSVPFGGEVGAISSAGKKGRY